MRDASWAAMSFSFFVAAGARSDVGSDRRAAAAVAFDDAVNRFDRAEYDEAARQFLQADALAQSDDALANAIAAAKKANDHLLVVEAAERALARSVRDGALATTARDALADSARSLARIDLACDPTPCTLTLDGAEIPSGSRYVLPGTHAAAAKTGDGAVADERLSLIAGASYTVRIHPTPAGAEVRPANVSTDLPEQKPGAGAPPPPAADRTPAGERKPLSPAIFYGGVVASAALTGVWIWSGIDTLKAKADLPKPSTTAKNDAVESKALRSDILFAAAAVVTGLTITSGFLWVDWGGDRGATALVVPLRGGAAGGVEGRF